MEKDINPPPDAEAGRVQIAAKTRDARPETPIARNANPAGVSTARTGDDIPLEVTPEESASGTKAKSASDAEASKVEYPIARNANPAGVSTSRTQE